MRSESEVKGASEGGLPWRHGFLESDWAPVVPPTRGGKGEFIVVKKNRKCWEEQAPYALIHGGELILADWAVQVFGVTNRE